MKQRYIPTHEAEFEGKSSFIDTKTKQIHVLNDIYDICEFLNKISS